VHVAAQAAPGERTLVSWFGLGETGRGAETVRRSWMRTIAAADVRLLMAAADRSVGGA